MHLQTKQPRIQVRLTMRSTRSKWTRSRSTARGCTTWCAHPSNASSPSGYMQMHIYHNCNEQEKAAVTRTDPPLDATERRSRISRIFCPRDPTRNALDKKNPLQMTSIGAVLALLCAGTAAGFNANHAVAGAIRARPLLHLTHHAGHAHSGAAWSCRPIVPRPLSHEARTCPPSRHRDMHAPSRFGLAA